jgi:hypothetical protein
MKIIRSTCSAVRRGFFAKIKEATPVTNGAEKELPVAW